MYADQAASYAGHAVEQVSTDGLDTETKRAGNQGANALIEGSDITDESVESVCRHSPNKWAVTCFCQQLVRHCTRLFDSTGKVRMCSKGYSLKNSLAHMRHLQRRSWTS